MDQKQAAGLIILGGAGLAIGSFLPWGEIFGVTTSGMDGGDGWFTLTAGIVLVGVGYLAFTGAVALPEWLGWVALVVGAGVAILNYFDISGIEGVGVGIGVWIMLAGSVLALAGAVVALVGLLMGGKKA
jgi:hypothetical protein